MDLDAGKSLLALALAVALVRPALAEGIPDPLSREDAKKLENPIPYSKGSIARGRQVYIRGTCHECHDMDGRALSGSDLAEAADLTDPRSWKFGTSDGEIFADVREGTPGQMPGFKGKIEDRDIWHLVNYTRSIGPKALRPDLVKEEPPPAEPEAEQTVDPKTLVNPAPYSRASIAQGRNVYIRGTCQECHDMDGRALSGSDLAEAADLTDPRSWKFGTTDGHIFIGIRDGTGGQMPGFKDKIKDEQVWHLVNYIRSIGPKKSRPELRENPR